MNARERFNAVMAFEKTDCLPFMEFMFYWPETRDRWISEGMSADADPVAFFGYDPFQWLPVDFNFVPAFTPEILEEDETMRVVRDVTGVVKREYKYGSAMPHYIEFPIKTRRDFLGLKDRLDPTSPARYPANWDEWVRNFKDREHPVGLVTRGLFAFFRDFMEFTDMSMAFMEQPEWIHEVMDFHTDFICRLWERAVSDVEVDMVLFGEDMAFKIGPMVGPEFVREFMVPRYKKITDFLRDHGVRTMFIDSDGDMRSLIPCFLEGGFTGVLPLEGAANCDPVAIRRMYPHLQMLGGLNKMELAKGGAAMYDELEKVAMLGPVGGYIPSFDHSVHPSVSYATYQDYLARLRRLCETSI